jgi:hypothetical protein
MHASSSSAAVWSRRLYQRAVPRQPLALSIQAKRATLAAAADPWARSGVLRWQR